MAASKNDGQTPLHVAVMISSPELVSLLLHSGANPNHVTHDAHTALHTAAREGRVDVLSMLLEAGADPEAKNKVYIMYFLRCLY
ncbi:unnamed protein product [Protopolystoma xenopodis]|uniref:Uncharacterized protein n=1 Tax=Protopolystoma xenopodis TaxID=117903 RepID=A0A3S4ZPX7_9PLAT|nr:unnamed protein product [Protopolystoma xenopodis]